MIGKVVLLGVLWAGLIPDCDDGERASRREPTSLVSAAAQERTAALAESMAQIGVADRGDCGKLASDLRKLADKEKPQLLETSERAKPPGADDDERRFLSERGLDSAHAARIQAARQQMQPSLDSCAGNPDVRDAMKRLTR